jgi:hypothetical protein
MTKSFSDGKWLDFNKMFSDFPLPTVVTVKNVQVWQRPNNGKSLLKRVIRWGQNRRPIVLKTRVCLTLWPFQIYIKKHPNAKEELWKFKYFTTQNTFFKKSSKRTKILQDIIILLLIQVSTQAKISSFKNPHIRIDLLLPRGQNPLSYYTL